MESSFRDAGMYRVVSEANQGECPRHASGAPCRAVR